ncbi:hypothetical protein U1Q18_004360 [Sarracenia purpurea var. burkii]
MGKKRKSVATSLDEADWKQSRVRTGLFQNQIQKRFTLRERKSNQFQASRIGRLCFDLAMAWPEKSTATVREAVSGLDKSPELYGHQGRISICERKKGKWLKEEKWLLKA